MNRSMQQRRQKRGTARMRPGRILIIPPPLFQVLGCYADDIIVQCEAGRIVLSKRRSPQETRLARLKARLAQC